MAQTPKSYSVHALSIVGLVLILFACVPFVAVALPSFATHVYRSANDVIIVHGVAVDRWAIFTGGVGVGFLGASFVRLLRR